MEALISGSPMKSKGSMAEAWELFREKGIVADWVRPIIARSWQRSQEAGIKDLPRLLSSRDLRSRQEWHAELLQIARPVMQEICRIAGQNYIEFHDQDGYSLEGYGNSIFPPAIGFNCSESAIGTSGIGIALIEDLAIEIHRFEHYARWLHSYSCVAAPIHDQQGNILAVINITNPFGGLPEWTFHVLCLGVKVIETQYLQGAEGDGLQQLRKAFSHMVTLLDKGREKNPSSKFPSEKVLGVYRFSNREDLAGKNVGDLTFLKDIKEGKGGAAPVSKNQTEGKSSSNQEKAQKQADPSERTHSLDPINGVHPVWRDIKNTVLRAVPYKPNFLIEGETGTGKEVLARVIHSLSGRRGRFVPINCGAIPVELIQSELFGYEEGAFTGAQKGGKLGKLELANEGTLFLDEIGEMPLPLQANLLRFLQDKTIVPLGSNTAKVLDVLIIAATNRSLITEIRQGNFRADLFYRLNVVNITIPPLRKRREDIPWLVRNLLLEIGEHHNCPITISEEAMVALGDYDWPGNVRELRNALEFALIHSDENYRIEKEDLPKHMVEKSEMISKESIYHNKHMGLKDHEKELIKSTLQVFRGNISAAAKALGISRVTLYKKLQTYKITD